MTKWADKEPVRVTHPSWKRSVPQVWRDDWRNADRILRFTGQCVVCGRRTYAFDDGQNDPRGVLGDHAGSPLIAEEYGHTGSDVPMCFDCGNTYERYQIGVRIAEAQWAREEMVGE